MKLVYSPQAKNDIKCIKDYISNELSSLDAANRTAKGILKSCSNLKDYSAFYSIDNDTVKIIRILDGRTNYMKYLFGDI